MLCLQCSSTQQASYWQLTLTFKLREGCGRALESVVLTRAMWGARRPNQRAAPNWSMTMEVEAPLRPSWGGWCTKLSSVPCKSQTRKTLPQAPKIRPGEDRVRLTQPKGWQKNNRNSQKARGEKRKTTANWKKSNMEVKGQISRAALVRVTYS